MKLDILAVVGDSQSDNVKIQDLTPGKEYMLQDKIEMGLTFDDVLLLPAMSSVMPRETSLRTKLTAKITLNIPLISAAMDTVTEASLAIAMAREGGIGIIHRAMPAHQKAHEKVKEKKHESGLITRHLTISPNET